MDGRRNVNEIVNQKMTRILRIRKTVEIYGIHNQERRLRESDTRRKCLKQDAAEGNSE